MLSPSLGFGGSPNQKTPPNPTLSSVSLEASFLLLTAAAGEIPLGYFATNANSADFKQANSTPILVKGKLLLPIEHLLYARQWNPDFGGG